MSVFELLEREIGLLVEAVERRPLGRLATLAPSLRHLVRRLADAGEQLEGAQHHPLPPIPPQALADALTVTGTDLQRNLARTPDRRIAAACLAEVLVHRQQVDGQRPGRGALALASDILTERDGDRELFDPLQYCTETEEALRADP